MLNEIIWTYHGPSPIRRAFNRKHDTILSYVKSKEYVFNADDVRKPYNPNTVITFKSSRKAGFGKVPDLERGKVPEDWWYFPVVARLHNERTGYPTQKPEALLERVILASSNPGDIVADFFCGSGTTPLIATQNGRRFIACDATFRAVQTTRGRLAESESLPFALERSQTHPWKVKSSPASAFNIRPASSTIQLGRARNVDFWEVDPDWDGEIFKSAAQARRHARSGVISQEIKVKAGRKVCIRLVTVRGELHQIVL
jgi:hypothetical protein